MVHTDHGFSGLVLLVGLTIIAALLVKAGLRRIRVPGLVGFLALGFGLRLLDQRWDLLSSEGEAVFGFLSSVGVVALLFRIGLESNLRGLLEQLPRAGWIWVGNVVLSAVGVYVTARWLLGFGRVPSLFASVSLTATSVGVAMAVWREKQALNTPEGELLVDVAELDDISGVALMAILFAILPILHGGGGPETLLADAAGTAGWFLVKLVLFTVGCFLFSRYVEERLSDLFKRTGHPETTMLLVTGSGLVIAALAGWLGFSLAIGALFAGLLFSRDPDATKFDTSFESVYELFTPFFFIGIGMDLDPGGLLGGASIGAVLLAPAVATKVVGAGLPAVVNISCSGALLIGLSMAPRAEIALIIMQRGRAAGEWAVPPSLYAGIVLVSASTCVVVPWLLSGMLESWTQRQGGEDAGS